MLEHLGNIKAIALFATMIGMLKTAPQRRSDSAGDEPHFYDDPVPGDSFPHHIFYKR